MAQRQRVRKAYGSPKLTVFGPVSKLTRGGTGTRPDGGNAGFNHGRGRGR